jgi:hypothetical protein
MLEITVGVNLIRNRSTDPRLRDHITTSAISCVSPDLTPQRVQHLIGQRCRGSRILAGDEIARHDDFRLKEDVLISIAKEYRGAHLPWLCLLVQPTETDQFALQQEWDILSQQTLNSHELIYH